MASNPADQHVHTIRDFGDLVAAVNDVTATVCQAVTEQPANNPKDALPWCHAGNLPLAPPKCKELPPIDFSSTTNVDYLRSYGTTCAVSKPKVRHVCDGKFTDWTVRWPISEWEGVTPAIGRFTIAYEMLPSMV